MKRELSIEEMDSITVQQRMTIEEARKLFPHAPLTDEELDELLDALNTESTE